MTRLAAANISPIILGGSGDVVSRLIMGISRVIIWVLWGVYLLTMSPRPSKVLLS